MTSEDLKQQAAVIRDENKNSANTALRVGKLLIDMVEYTDDQLDSLQEGMETSFGHVVTKQELATQLEFVKDLGEVDRSSVAEDAAITLAGQKKIKIIFYRTSNGQVGIIQQVYSNNGNTKQFLTLNGVEYVRTVNYTRNTKTDWYKIDKASLVYKLLYDADSRTISFHDPIDNVGFGGISLPLVRENESGMLSNIQYQKLNGFNIYESATPSGSKVPVVFTNPITGATATFDLLGATTARAGVMTSEHVKELSQKAPLEGYAPNLKVHFANELVGRNYPEEQIIKTIRPTGVISIGDGNATITTVKGNSVVWNQLAEQPSTEFIPTVHDYYRAYRSTTLSKVDTNHRYLAVIKVVCTDASGNHPALICGLFNGKSVGSFDTAWNAKFNSNETYGHFFTPVDSNYTKFGFFCKHGDNGGSAVQDDQRWIMDIQVHDLTLMFGAGYEPTTLETFYSAKPINIGNSNSTGEIITFYADGLKSVGFNACDEEWEVGGLANGVPSNTSSQIRSKNFIPCVGGTTYYGCMGWSPENFLHLAFYDERKVHLENIGFNRKTVTIPANAAFFKVYTTRDCGYGNVYRHDICVNLSHTGYRNGEYVPYEDDYVKFGVKEIKDANGESLFPNGLASAGSVCDEITATRAIKRVGVIDLGSLSWKAATTQSGQKRMVANLSGIKAVPNADTLGNILCARYNTLTANQVYTENTGISVEIQKYAALSLYDPNYTNPSEFKSAMIGVQVYYELNVPVVVELDKPINLSYNAWDFGTESLVSDGVTAPLKADIVYLFNAVDRIRENSYNIKQNLNSHIKDLGEVSTSSIAEDAAISLAGDKNLRLIFYRTSDGQVGTIRQVHSFGDGTMQYLTLNGSEYVRVVYYHGGQKSPWRNIDKASLVYQLRYNPISRRLEFHDPIQDEGFGGVSLPEATINEAGLMSALDKQTLGRTVYLGMFSRSGDAEAKATEYASDRSKVFLVYDLENGQNGVVEQFFSNTSATIQFLYLNGSRYVREVRWGVGEVGAWKNVTGSERISGLAFDSETGVLSLKDALGARDWGSVTLPFGQLERLQSFLSKLEVAFGTTDLDTIVARLNQ